MSKWETVKLGDVCNVITKGTTPTTIGYDFQDDGINFIKIESISENGDFVREKFAYINDECNEKMSRSQLQENDILFSIAGAIGRTAIVSEEILPANTNQALSIIRIKSNNLKHRFVVYALKSDAIYKQFEKQKQGVAQLNLSLKNISDLIIPIPPLQVQKQIAFTLDLVTDLINKRKKQLEKLDELVKSRFVEMFGACNNNIRLAELSTLITKGASPKWQGIEYAETGVLFVTSENVREGYIDISTPKYLEEKVNEKQPRSILKKGDILINIVGASIGRAAIYEHDVIANINQAVSLVRLNNKVISKFLITFLNSEDALKQYYGNAKGGARDNLERVHIK